MTENKTRVMLDPDVALSPCQTTIDPDGEKKLQMALSTSTLIRTNSSKPSVSPPAGYVGPSAFLPSSVIPSSVEVVSGTLRRSITSALHNVTTIRPSLLLLLILLPAVVCVTLSGLVLNVYSTNFDSHHHLDLSVGQKTAVNRSRRLPHCLIIGVRKGGTRAVLKFLSVHPSVKTAGREAHFFDRDSRYRHGIEWYRQRMPFSQPGEFTVEKTPGYFHHPLVPERVHRFSPQVKLIVVLRDPVDRTVSDYTQVLANRRKKRRKYFSFEELAFTNDSSHPKRVRSSYRAIWRSLYNIHMEEWLRHFPLSSFHFVDGQRLVSDPAMELRRVENFLGIPNYIKPHHFYFNKSRGFYCLRKGGCLCKSKGRKHPFLNETTISTLRSFFEPHIRQFYQLIGRDFGWYLP